MIAHMSTRDWEKYQDIAVYLLDKFKEEFGLEHIEGKQKVIGKRSSQVWTLDAKGVKKGNVGFIIIECRRFLTSKQKPEHIGGIAYRIIDTGAQGGIIISPLGLQKGAKKIAKAENITELYLHQNSDIHQYLIRFLNKVMTGVKGEAHADGMIEYSVKRLT